MQTGILRILLLFSVFAGTVNGEDEFHPHQMAPRANQGNLPPPPRRSTASHEMPEEKLPNGGVNQAPHVSHNRWYGHSDPDDPRYRLTHPFEKGLFPLIGLNSRYGITHIDRAHRRIWFAGGYFFEVAEWEWQFFLDWCWECGDDFALYDDPYHPGWYLLYNIHTGVYVHALYSGKQ